VSDGPEIGLSLGHSKHLSGDLRAEGVFETLIHDTVPDVIETAFEGVV